jgi:alkylation response protein AidB-like acyl-CoA dehydrogenase
MRLEFSDEELAFREEVRSFLRQQLSPSISEKVLNGYELGREDHLQWQRRLHDRGWGGMSWPVEFGGAGWNSVQQYIFEEESALAGAPRLIPFGIKMVAPVIMTFGSAAQQQRYLPKISAGEEWWCQGYSEPGAGSDLASLRTRGELDGDDIVVNGQKVWTSYAQFARWGILLARTDPNAPKAKGISFFICDMQQPGVTVRPLRQMTGGEEFNEVFLEDVFIPREHLVGVEHDGWKIANTTLTHERGTSPRQLVINRMLLDDLLRLAREGVDGGAPAAADARIRQRLAQHWIEVEITKLNNWRTLTRIGRKEALGPEASFVKLFWSEMSQRIHDTLMDVLGPTGLCWQPGPHAIAGGRLVRSWLYYRSASIFAGTSEIQRNILAERVLGLPRSR